MKHLLWLALLLPFFANAQTNGTIQKTSATGTIRGSFGSLGLDTLVNVNAPTNGFVPVYNSTLKKSVWTNPSSFTPTISFGTFGSTPNAQGGSYSGGVITLQPASTTHPGGVTTGAQNFLGEKRFYASGGGYIGLNSTSTPKMSIINSLYDLNIGNNGDEINFNYNSYDFILKPLSHPSSNVTLNLPATSGTLLLDNGSGSGLSGVVLTSTNQTIGGDKTFSSIITATSGVQTSSSDALSSTGTGTVGNYVTLQNTGGTLIYGIDSSTGAVTGSGYKSFIAYPNSRSFSLYRNGSGNVLTADASSNITLAGTLSSAGSISSTPQGTLYGTATGSITSSQLATSLTDETGTGSAVFSASPTFTGTIIGASSNFSGSMGIGISPTFPLHVSKSLVNNYVAQLANTNTTAGTSFGVLINAGTNSSDVSLAINNAANSLGLLTSFGNGDFAIGGSNATKASGTAWINPSDLRLKTNVGEYSKGLAEVLKIKPKTWYFNEASGLDKTQKHLSPIAQELQQVMPEMVSTYKGKLNGKEQELLQVDASDMTWLLVKAIQEQQAIIEKLNARITVLENK